MGILSKEQFCELINWALEQEDKEKKLHSDLQEYTGNKDFTGFHTNITTFIVNFLEKAMADKGGYISWWVWETNRARTEKELYTIAETNGKEWVISNPEKLYDYLLLAYPLSGTRRQIVCEAQDNGAKFILKQMIDASYDYINEMFGVSIRKLVETAHQSYRLASGSKELIDEKNWSAEYSPVFRRQDE